MSAHPSRGHKPDLVDLKRQIEMNQYEVDSKKVAAALIRKVELVKMARLELVGPVGRIPSQDGLSPRHRPA